jgi:metallo-beta-lactamase family protein
MKLTFCGAARTVTGSKHLVTTHAGRNILLDCGLYQGVNGTDDLPTQANGSNPKDKDAKEVSPYSNWQFPFDSAAIHTLVLSHAHIDHAGSIPRLVKLGFKGTIWCTPATYDLCEIMLADSAHIQEQDVAYVNKKRMAKNLPPIQPLYEQKDVDRMMQLMKRIDYNKPTTIEPGVTLTFTDTGHILGSAAVSLAIQDKARTIRLTFTGDIGRPHDKILRDPAPFPQADYIICESTYGNRLHEPRTDTDNRLLQIITDTCVKQKGKLIIPAFSLGRTQELVYAMDRMNTERRMPPIKVFVDSPLSVNATDVMRQHPECFNDDIRDYMQHDPDPFGYGKLTYIQDVEASKRLNDLKEPCIIISASGMAEAGRIKHHIKNNIGDARNTILLVGYASPTSLGGALRAGKNPVRIFGDWYEVKAGVQTMDAFSAHADYNEMLRFLSCQDKAQVQTIFLVHGEYDVQQDWRNTLRANGYPAVEIPDLGQVVNLA